MRLWTLLLLATSFACAQTPAAKLWNDLAAKREHARVHQELDVTRTVRSGPSSQNSKWKVTIDWSDGQWRERQVTSWGTRTVLFTGADLYTIEAAAGEYIQERASDTPAPSIYGFDKLDFARAVDAGRKTYSSRECVVFDIPYRAASASEGIARLTVDSETGVVIDLYTALVENIDGHPNSRQLTFATANVRFNEPSTFTLATEGLKKVDEFSRWSAERLLKTFAGQPPPAWTAVDLDGGTFALDSLQSKVVLLDFWATWCPPCKEDIVPLQKLQARYGSELLVIGVNASEERPIVEAFLREHLTAYPVVLSAENELPTPLQFSTLPTYVLLNKGKVVDAAEGSQGEAGLVKLLEKAGLTAK
jgi:thiol-disulfide isomerase/thioredoxin